MTLRKGTLCGKTEVELSAELLSARSATPVKSLAKLPRSSFENAQFAEIRLWLGEVSKLGLFSTCPFSKLTSDKFSSARTVLDENAFCLRLKSLCGIRWQRWEMDGAGSCISWTR
jgi:hypothetical protein